MYQYRNCEGWPRDSKLWNNRNLLHQLFATGYFDHSRLTYAKFQWARRAKRTVRHRCEKAIRYLFSLVAEWPPYDVQYLDHIIIVYHNNNNNLFCSSFTWSCYQSLTDILNIDNNLKNPPTPLELNWITLARCAFVFWFSHRKRKWSHTNRYPKI